MRADRRRLLVSAAAILGLLAPIAPLAPAAGAASAGGDNSQKQTLMQQLKDAARTKSSPPKSLWGGNGSLSAGRLDRLAAERDKARVIISVKVRPGAKGTSATLTTVAGSARAHGGKQRQTLSKLGRATFEVPAAAAKSFTATMRARRDVAKVDVVHRRSMSLVPNDPKYTAEAAYLNAVTAPAAWDKQQGSPAVRIAVIDSGVDVNHPDLVGRVADTYNGVDASADVTDIEGHGTFVAGVAAASGDNGIGIAGASMGSSILAVKVADASGDIWTDAEAAGIIWAADHGANVMNISLGSADPDSLEGDAITYAISQGVLVVAAAGNEATTAPSYPAAYPQVIAVGATNVATGTRATFSNYGPWVTVAAPGVNITGTAPIGGSDFFEPSYDISQGTSFSSPIVAAEAALLFSLRPGASAADVRTAIVRSSQGYSNLGLGAGQVDFRAALDALKPGTVPTLTLPGDGDEVDGVVQLSATSAAAKVGFKIDNVLLGTPVATAGGTATTRWTSWGAGNGPHEVSASDCSAGGVCNDAEASQVGVTVANAAPVVTSPTASQTLTGTGSFTATAPGGGVAFLIDGVRRGFDATSPYSLLYPITSLADGTHAVTTVSCSVTGSACGGPTSLSVSFIAKSLHPRVTSVSPATFSPNGDGRFDATTLTYYLPDTEGVLFRVRNAAGTVVRGPSNYGTLGVGTRAIIWNGLLNNGSRAGNGIYTLELDTTRLPLRGSLVAQVRVDVSAPSVTSVTGSGTTFYPYPDSYKDTFAPTFSLNEASTVTLAVTTSKGVAVKNLYAWRGVGRSSIVWNGTNTAGLRVPAGTYYWTLSMQDPAGNRRGTVRYSVVVNALRQVTKTVTLSQRGVQFYSAGGSAACAGASTSLSDFRPYGVWLANDCDAELDGFQIAGAIYRFALPVASNYTSLRMVTYGNSFYAPSTLGAAFTQWGTGDFTFSSEITVGDNNAWRTFGTQSAAGLVSSGRVAESTVYVPNDFTTTRDFDISTVGLVVTYQVFV